MANIFPYPLSEILFQRPASSFYEINFSIYLVLFIRLWRFIKQII